MLFRIPCLDPESQTMKPTLSSPFDRTPSNGGVELNDKIVIWLVRSLIANKPVQDAAELCKAGICLCTICATRPDSGDKANVQTSGPRRTCA